MPSFIMSKDIPGGPSKGDLWCTACGQTYNYDRIMPVPITLGHALLEAWNKDHRNCLLDDPRYSKYVNFNEVKYFTKKGEEVKHEYVNGKLVFKEREDTCSKSCQPDTEPPNAVETAPITEEK